MGTGILQLVMEEKRWRGEQLRHETQARRSWCEQAAAAETWREECGLQSHGGNKVRISMKMQIYLRNNIKKTRIVIIYSVSMF